MLSVFSSEEVFKHMGAELGSWWIRMHNATLPSIPPGQQLANVKRLMHEMNQRSKELYRAGK